jgi:hypothetical protein
VVSDSHDKPAFDSLLGPSRSDTIQLWSLLPKELAALFRPKVTDVAAEVLIEINRSIPVYDRPREGQFGRTVAHGVQQAIEQFVARLADPDAEQDTALFRKLGRHELVNGRNLDVLQSAYRIGARVAWRRMAALGQQAGIPVGTLGVLAEAIFVYMDELSALSIEGYTTAQAREAGTLERRRRRLLKLLLNQPASSGAIATAARAARWPLPDHVFAVALEPLDADDAPKALTLAGDILLDLEGTAPCLVVPDAEVRRLGELESGWTGWRSAVGPKVRLRDAPRSLRWARRALTLVHRGVLDDVPVTWCADHLATLWLFSDLGLAELLADKALLPLADLSPAARGRLSPTLLEWLKTRGNVTAAAEALGLHPQTVRNRLRQLTELFGERLNDPDDRFEMETVLRVLAGRGWPATADS